MRILVACGKVSLVGESGVEARWKAESFMTAHSCTKHSTNLLGIRLICLKFGGLLFFNTCGAVVYELNVQHLKILLSRHN